MQTLECVLWHSGLKCEVVFDQGGLSRGGLYIKLKRGDGSKYSCGFNTFFIQHLIEFAIERRVVRT